MLLMLHAPECSLKMKHFQKTSECAAVNTPETHTVTFKSLKTSPVSFGHHRLKGWAVLGSGVFNIYK